MRTDWHRRARAWLRRALEGITPRVWALLAAAVLVQSLSMFASAVLLELRRGRFTAWLGQIGVEALLLAVVFVPVLLGVTAVANLGPRRGLGRIASLSVAVAVTVLLGMILRREVHLWFGLSNVSLVDWLAGALHRWIEYAVMAGTVTAVAELIRRQRASVAAMHKAQIDRIALDREMAEARLQVMQAQIEPHFLFNTLANVRRLYQTDPVAGDVMLSNLMRYFAVALPRMRESDSDLAHEKDLIEAYLNIHRIRMGTRLAFAVDFPPALGNQRVPPMMLLTLVENAIKHGLNPLPEGGFIRVTAAIDEPALVLRVIDSGRGFDAGEGAGAGTGLANIRGRLQAQYGAAAGLTLTGNEPRGVTAQIVMPMTRERAVA